MEAGLHSVDQDQGVAQLGNLLGQAKDGPFAGSHMKLRVPGAALLCYK